MTRYDCFPGTASRLPFRLIDPACDVRAWEIGEDFLLFTCGAHKSECLLVASHGWYYPWSGTTPLPVGARQIFWAPHGARLHHPGLDSLMLGNGFSPYAGLTGTAAVPLASAAYGMPVQRLSGSTVPGQVKDYTLGKHRSGCSPDWYRYLAGIMVTQRRQAASVSGQRRLHDVLTVRRRRLRTMPSLSGLFADLERLAIAYGRIEHGYCRENALSLHAPAYYADQAMALD